MLTMAVNDGMVYQRIVDSFITKRASEQVSNRRAKILDDISNAFFMACHLSRRLTFTNPRSVEPL